MERYLCIHGHFYQPPRESPWLETIELQDSAFPYHDWNERVTAECYAPNATSRRLDGDGRIVEIVNNYARISFNFGPTLLAWMQERAPDVLAALVDADRLSRARFSGHGSALAQAFNHMILPLANRRDKQTQVLWGIRAFQHRFGRQPEGMWLPETAADVETLEVLAQHGIQFTILSPYQASRVRPLRGGTWTDVSGGRVDPSRAYRVRLRSRRSIAVFFFDAPLSKAVAFEQLLNSGDAFVARLMEGFDDRRGWNQMVHIATDGESYGHHHRYGEMALAHALHRIEAGGLVRLTNYAEFLERHPPLVEVQIHEKSAWSCSHGVGRWSTDCGCNSGGRPGWHQRWRAPLRAALDWLRDVLAPRFESMAAGLLRDPWAARDDYIAVTLDRSDASVAAFFERQASTMLDEGKQITALRFLELQRHAMLMYTSCGWFFDELSGPETIQVLQYAGRALQLAQTLFNEDLEPEFLRRLAEAPSNIPDHRHGKAIYEKFVKPAVIDREKLSAHFAVSSIFEHYPDSVRIYACNFEQQQRQLLRAGKARLIMGRSKVTFEITRAWEVLSYAALHLGDHNVNGGVRTFRGDESYQLMLSEFTEAFNRADFPEVIRLIDRHFGNSHYSVKNLFRDEQRKVLRQVLASTEQDIENHYRQIAEQHTPLTRFLKDIGAPLPVPLKTAVDFVLNSDLRRQFEEEDADPARVRALLAQAHAGNVELEGDLLAYAIKASLDRRLERLVQSPDDLSWLSRTSEFVDVVASTGIEINLWKTQNLCFQMIRAVAPERRARAADGDVAATEWLRQFNLLSERLGFKVNGCLLPE